MIAFAIVWVQKIYKILKPPNIKRSAHSADFLIWVWVFVDTSVQVGRSASIQMILNLSFNAFLTLYLPKNNIGCIKNQ